MGGESDGIVPFLSQFDNNSAYLSSNSSNTFYGVHSSGTESLGFLPPSVLDAVTDVPQGVVKLLNSPISNTAVFEVIP